MRIGLLTNNVLPAREGIGRHVTELGRGLRARGHEVILVGRGSGRRWQEGETDGLRVRRFPSFGPPPSHHLVAHAALSRWLAGGADGIDLLHIQLPLLPPLPTALPVVVTVHTPMLTDAAAIIEPGIRARLLRLQARLLSRRFEQAWLDRADRLIAVSDAVCGELKEHYDVHGRMVDLVTNGVDTRFFSPEPVEKGRPFLVAIGRLAVRKGTARLLEAFAAAADPELRLKVIGEGPLRPDLERRVQALGIADMVEFTGFLGPEEVRAALRGAVGFVNPADYESGPLTLLEAMACGTPVISTATGLARELGTLPPVRLVEPDVEAMAAAITELRAEPDAAARRAARARSLVSQRFSWDRVVDAVEGIYGVPHRLAA